MLYMLRRYIGFGYSFTFATQNTESFSKAMLHARGVGPIFVKRW